MAALFWLLAQLALAQAQHPHVPTGTERQWGAWGGRDEAFVRATLGDPDRVVGAHWYYDDLIVGNASSGPYTRYDVDVTMRRGHVVRVRAVAGASVSCIVTE